MRRWTTWKIPVSCIERCEVTLLKLLELNYYRHVYGCLAGHMYHVHLFSLLACFLACLVHCYCIPSMQNANTRANTAKTLCSSRWNQNRLETRVISSAPDTRWNLVMLWLASLFANAGVYQPCKTAGGGYIGCHGWTNWPWLSVAWTQI